MSSIVVMLLLPCWDQGARGDLQLLCRDRGDLFQFIDGSVALFSWARQSKTSLLLLEEGLDVFYLFPSPPFQIGLAQLFNTVFM